METLDTYKIVTAFIIATALYASSLNGLDKQLHDAGIATTRTAEQVQAAQAELDYLIKETINLTQAQ